MLPLDDLKILDMSRLAAGNMVSHMLADFGADVIKVEKPGKGDDLRNWKVNDVSHWWAVYSRNKRSLALNLKQEEGLGILKDLVKSADVFIENFVPGTLEKWGIGPDQLMELNKNLIILRISGWGQTGIYKNSPGFGSLVEGMSGFASMTGEENQTPLLPPLALADMVAGLTGFGAILMSIIVSKKNQTSVPDWSENVGEKLEAERREKLSQNELVERANKRNHLLKSLRKVKIDNNEV